MPSSSSSAACLVLLGHPSSGKTTTAQLIRDRALQRADVGAVHVVNEEAVFPNNAQERQKLYGTATQEKSTRGALKAALDRALATSSSSSNSGKTLVLLDSLNYIKGYRYELYCISKEARAQHGVVWIVNDVRVARDWNATSERYPVELWSELAQRFEPPDARHRWDHPLFRLDVRPDAVRRQQPTMAAAQQSSLQQSVYNMHQLSDVLGQGGGDQGSGNNSNGQTASGASDAKESTSTTTTKRPKASFKRATKKTAKKKPQTPTDSTTPTTLTASSLQALQQHQQQSESETATTAVATTTTASENTTDDNSHPTKTRSTKPTQEDQESLLSLRDQIDALLDAFFRTQPLQQGAATQFHVASDADYLNRLDALTQDVCHALIQQQQQQLPSASSTSPSERDPNAPEGVVAIRLASADVIVNVSPSQWQRLQQSSMDQLQRTRRNYLQWMRRTGAPSDTTPSASAQAFVDYVVQQQQQA